LFEEIALAGTTIAFGVVLIVLGVAGYFGSGAASVTALIPAIFGVVLAGLGVLARNEGMRKHAMHGAVLIGLVGFLGSARGLLQLPALMSGGEVARPAAVIAQSVMALLMLLFVVLCVRSFINARVRRG
jgi:hypothetical protein